MQQKSGFKRFSKCLEPSNIIEPHLWRYFLINNTMFSHAKENNKIEHS